MRTLACLAVLVLGLGACSPTMIVLRQPKTGEIAECSTKVLVASVLDHVEACAKRYAQEGYQQQIP